MFHRVIRSPSPVIRLLSQATRLPNQVMVSKVILLKVSASLSTHHEVPW